MNFHTTDRHIGRIASHHNHIVDQTCRGDETVDYVYSLTALLRLGHQFTPPLRDLMVNTDDATIKTRDQIVIKPTLEPQLLLGIGNLEGALLNLSTRTE